MRKFTLQKMKKEANDDYEMAYFYYSFVSALNSLSLTERELQLVSFTAVKGNITYSNVRNEFCKKYETSVATINNIISKMRRIGVFVKEGKIIHVNQKISLNFANDIIMEIKLIHKEE